MDISTSSQSYEHEDTFIFWKVEVNNCESPANPNMTTEFFTFSFFILGESGPADSANPQIKCFPYFPMVSIGIL